MKSFELIRQALQRSLPKSAALAVALNMNASGLVVAEEFQTRAQDLMYGEALYYYHQGEFFDALTRLKVAKERGGIAGHGDHPWLVEGGLMLAYGMTRSAGEHFERLLESERSALVSDVVKTQAWFYLGKVYYLEQDYVSAYQAFQRVDEALLAEADPTLRAELSYYAAQLKLVSSELNLPLNETENYHNSLWSTYAEYNQALAQIQSGKASTLVSEQLELSLAKLLAAQEKGQNASETENTERVALIDRLRLTLAQIYLSEAAYERAIDHLKRIPKNSLVSDEALFQYAVAASHLQQFELALGLLNTLRERSLFTPWLEQVPYAMAFLYEQLGEIELAAKAYQAAAEYYEEQISNLNTQSAELDQSRLLDAITNDAGLTSTDVTRSDFTNNAPLSLGNPELENDAYGRLKVLPKQFYLVKLLASEAFQLGLRNLHELYKLKHSLSVWDQQLASFDLMLDTRRHQRQDKLQVVSKALQEQDSERWISETENYHELISAALEKQDAQFFMTEEQLEFAEQIQMAKATLNLLPKDEDYEEYAQKLERISAYFDYWVQDQYGVNRWQAEKQLHGLESAISEFKKRQSFLRKSLANTAFQQDLVTRVETSKTRLSDLSGQIDQAVEQESQVLLETVRAEIARQVLAIEDYRLASRHAQSRLLDSLYRQHSSPKEEPAQPVQEEAEEPVIAEPGAAESESSQEEAL